MVGNQGGVISRAIQLRRAPYFQIFSIRLILVHELEEDEDTSIEVYIRS